jgi:hypothetical protein
MRRVRIADCGVSLAFRLVGMDVYSFDNTRAAAVSPGRVKSLEDLSAGSLKGACQMLRGESPPGR